MSLVSEILVMGSYTVKYVRYLKLPVGQSVVQLVLVRSAWPTVHAVICSNH